jgi:DNA mismatch repair protein MutS
MNRYNQDIREVQSDLSNKVFETYLLFLDTLNDKYGNLFNPLVKYIEDVDWYTSCAKNVKNYKYTRPILSNNYDGHSYLKTKQLRHPIIERLLTQVPYVANDVDLGTDDVSGILLYGINSAGKSSISKAVGLSIIMAQAGMFVPCDELTFWPYHEIFTRIPSGDDMMKGQSTFVVEISELRNILKRATKNSLVIGDELASGTETVSALAIVSAGIVQLYERKTSFIFATHLHDLCKISVIKNLENLGIFHMSVTLAYEQKLVYDRILKKGQGPDSYGVLVCKSLGLGEDFLNLAHQIRNEVLDISSDVLSKKQSRYNSKLFVDVCSICKKKTPVQEVHHIKEQHLADTDGYIGNIHKNTLSNLMVVCCDCHDKIHNNEIFVEGYKQTSDGIELVHQAKPQIYDDSDLKTKIMDMRQNGHTLKSIQSTLNISMYKCKKIINLL